ncbi:MAG: YraN family protein [Gordonibacter sp.]|uniref:YraN family protein n=1 Tax=Gordonibacter sp. TaxID=1968902 RepID=UPI002FCBB0E1
MDQGSTAIQKRPTEKQGATRKTEGGRRSSAKGKVPSKKIAEALGEVAEAEPSLGKRNVELGRKGEDAAARFLDRRGYDIVERNWKCLAGEADIIARDGEALVFVEVKTRSSTDKGLPSEAVDAKKRRRYERIAALFLQDYEVVDVPVRFDVVSLVVVSPERALIRHHINAFAAG